MSVFSGKWIVVEGPDRIGKTTLIRNLQDRITKHGVNVMTNGFPRRLTPIGTLLSASLKTRDVIKDWKAQTLVFLADMLEAQTEMSAWRAPENGSGTVITDRYTMSTYAYAKAQYAMNSGDSQWLMNAIGLLPQPDIYVLLTPEHDDVSFLAERSGFGDEVTEREGIQRSVVANMGEFATHHTNSTVISVVVGKHDSPENVCDDVVMRELTRILDTHDGLCVVDRHNAVPLDEPVSPKRTYVAKHDTASTMPTII